MNPVMAILRWSSDPDETLRRYEQAVARWRQEHGARYAPPLQTAAGPGEKGGLVVVNVFASDEDHLNFGRNMGGPLERVGLPTPEVEHVEVTRLGWPS